MGSYYPFGLKHKGYNDVITSGGNSVAQKFKYNGIELEENTGLYEMDVRMYDPTIGRFNGIDPVTHLSQGTSVAFDNNPIYWADPSGADAIYNAGIGEYVINGTVVSFDEALAYAKAGGNADGNNDNTPDEKCCDNYFEWFLNQLNNLDNSSTNFNEYPDGKLRSWLGNVNSFYDFEMYLYRLDLVSAVAFGTIRADGKYIQTNGKIGNYFDRPYKFLSKNAKRYYNFHKRLNLAKNSLDWVGKKMFFGQVVFSSLDFVDNISQGNNEAAFGNVMDVTMARVGFMGPWGAGISLTYFGFQWAIDKGYISGKGSPVQNYRNSCFVAGTMILMEDGSEKKIEDINVGDKILSVDINTMNIESDKVVIFPKNMEKYNKIYMKYSNGEENVASPHHPFYVKGKGWAVYDIELAKKDLTFKVKQLELGDIVYYYDKGILKETRIVKLIDKKEEALMYNIKYVKKNNTFFANGILVHNRFNN